MCARMGIEPEPAKDNLPTATDLDLWAEEEKIREKTSHEVKTDAS